jgi:hypothetical protein
MKLAHPSHPCLEGGLALVVLAHHVLAPVHEPAPTYRPRTREAGSPR